MLTPHSSPLSEDEYFTIENSLMATAKGRRFLRCYLERNRGTEMQKLLSSIARLHRVTVGEAGFETALHRDLSSVLSNVTQLRETIEVESVDLGLQQIEASLLALTEVVEERSAGSGQEAQPPLASDGPHHGREMKLFEELATLFAPSSGTRSL